MPWRYRRREPGVWRGTTTISEMYTFLVTVLLMGIVKKNSLREYWSNSLLPRLLSSFAAMTTFHQQRYCHPK
jgi:hypothetical protein